MTTANVNIKKVLLRRGNTTQNNNYLGVYGEVSVDMEAKTLRIHDGNVAGGYTVTSGGGTDNVLRANVGAFQTYANANAATQTTEINSLRANITAANTAITNLTSNAAIQAILLDTLTGNAVTQSQVLDTLTSNAAAQATSLTTLLGNAVAQQTSLIDLIANAATQAQAIASVTGTYSNANVATYLSAFDGNILPSANVTYSLGSETRQWKDLWVSNNTIYIGNTPITVDGNTLLINNRSVSGSSDRLTNGEYSLILDSAGKLSFPGNLVIDNGVISNLNSIDDGALVVGSQIEVALEKTTISNQVTNSLGEDGPLLQTLSQIDVMAGNVTIGSQVINSAGDGSSLLAVASLLQTNASNLIIGYATLNSLEESTLQTVNLVEINSNNVLIGQRVTNLLNGNVTLDAFSGWEFSTDGNLTLPAGGDILNSNGQSVLTPVTVGNVAAGTEGALWYNTEDGRTYVYALDTWIDASPAVVPGNMVGYGQDGNITLNEDARINYANGVSIINSVYGDSQVANFLSAYTGNIAKIGATPLSIAAASVRLTSDNETWAFAPDGVITLPNGMTIESDGAPGVNATVTIGGNDTRVSIYNDGAPPGLYITANATGTAQQWVFGPDGDLAFPDGSFQTTAYTGGAGGTGNALVNGAYTVALQANGVLTLGGTATISNASEEFRLWADNDITVYRNGQDGYGVKAGNVEVYTDNGLRTLTNSNGFEIKTGSLTLPAGGTITEGGGISGAIRLTPSGGANEYQALVIYPTAGVPEGDHIHLTAGGGSTELYLGNDLHYVKLVNGGNIELRAATANLSAQASWEFDTTGNIDARQALGIKVPDTVPTNVAVINSTTGSWEANPRSDLATTGGSGSGLTVNVTETGGYASTIEIATAGTGYNNGDLITVTSGTSNATFTIVIAGRNTWQFDTTGSTTFPGNLTIQSNPFNPGTVISQANALMTVVTTGNAATYIGWGEFGNGEPGNIALVAFNDDAGVVAIQTGATTGPEAFNEWIFDAGGTLTFPTGGNLIFDSSATSVIDGVTSITANGNVTAAQYNFANGVNIFDTITGVTSINTSVSTLTVSDASGDYTYGALSYSYAVNGASNSFDIQYSAPLAFGNVDINVGNVTATGTANVANLIISGTAPGTLLGSTGDTVGMVRVDSNYIYYCTSTFVPASWTVGWDGSVGNTLFLAQGAYPTPQVGWTVTQNIYTFTIDTVTDDGYGHWQITWTGTAYGSPNGGTATLTNPNPATIWSRTPLAATTYANTNVAAYLTTANISTAGNITAGNLIGNISITGNVQGTSANVDLVAGSYTWTFNNAGNLVLPGNTFAVNYANGTTAALDRVYLLEAYANVTYTLPGSFTEDPCRYSVVSANVNVPSAWFNTSTYTFAPQKAGYWEITAAYDVYRNGEASIAIKKNNSTVAAAGSFNAVAQQITKIIYFNGSTDSANVVNVGGSALSRSQFDGRSWFQARWIGE